MSLTTQSQPMLSSVSLPMVSESSDIEEVLIAAEREAHDDFVQSAPLGTTKTYAPLIKEFKEWAAAAKGTVVYGVMKKVRAFRPVVSEDMFNLFVLQHVQFRPKVDRSHHAITPPEKIGEQTAKKYFGALRWLQEEQKQDPQYQSELKGQDLNRCKMIKKKMMKTNM